MYQKRSIILSLFGMNGQLMDIPDFEINLLPYFGQLRGIIKRLWVYICTIYNGCMYNLFHSVILADPLFEFLSYVQFCSLKSWHVLKSNIALSTYCITSTTIIKVKQCWIQYEYSIYVQLLPYSLMCVTLGISESQYFFL